MPRTLAPRSRSTTTPIGLRHQGGIVAVGQIVAVNVGIVALAGDFAWLGVAVAAAALVAGLLLTHLWQRRELALLGAKAPPRELVLPRPAGAIVGVLALAVLGFGVAYLLKGLRYCLPEADARPTQVVELARRRAPHGRGRSSPSAGSWWPSSAHGCSGSHARSAGPARSASSSSTTARRRCTCGRSTTTTCRCRRSRRPAARCSSCSRCAAPTRSRSRWRGSSTATARSSPSADLAARWRRSAPRASTCPTPPGATRSRYRMEEAGIDRRRHR